LKDIERRKGERGNSESFAALITGAYTTTFLGMVTLSPLLLLCPSKIFKQGYKTNFPLVYSALFNIVMEAVNLVLEKYLAEIQLHWQYHSASLHTTEFYTEYWHGLP
jgi:hypothetical protein